MFGIVGTAAVTKIQASARIDHTIHESYHIRGLVAESFGHYVCYVPLLSGQQVRKFESVGAMTTPHNEMIL